MPYDYRPPAYWGDSIPHHWENSIFCWRLAEFEFACKTLSQCGQDILINAIVRTCLTGQQCFYFLDFGANDGISESSTQFLEMAGWKGILVEPNPFLFNELNTHRISKSVLAALGQPSGIQSLLTSHASAKLGTLKSNLTDYQNIRLNAHKEPQALSEILVPVLSLDLFLCFFYEQFGAYPDFIKIDIEGGEEVAVNMLCAHAHRPSVLEIENNLRGTDCANKLLGLGYTCCCVLDSFVELWVHNHVLIHFDIIGLVKKIIGAESLREKPDSPTIIF